MTGNNLLRAYNDQAAVECCGYAVDGDVLVMLDIVGYKTACKSLWASTVNSPRKFYSISGGVRVCGGDVRQTKYRSFWLELPEQNAHNLVICNTRLLEASTLPGDATPFYIVTGTTTEDVSASANSIRLNRFVALLNQALDLPILSTWAQWLWQAGSDDQIITEVKFAGSVLGAWRVQTSSAKWAEVVQAGLHARCIGLE